MYMPLVQALAVAAFVSSVKAASLTPGMQVNEAQARSPIHRRDIGGSCSSDYDYSTFTCPVSSDNCHAGYHANAFYQDVQCNCVCDQNNSRRRGIEQAEPHSQEERIVAKKVEVRDSNPIHRRDIGGSCSSDYDYWTLTCPVDSDNCLAGYHANAFYQDGQCNCVCDQNDSRRRGAKSKGRSKVKTVMRHVQDEKAIAKTIDIKDGSSIHRRDLGGSCSSDYDYWTLTCPVDSDNCLAGYHANAFYQDGQCNCVCDQD
eukprot:Awhi_evm1s14670